MMIAASSARDGATERAGHVMCGQAVHLLRPSKTILNDSR
jgi:hypothetical protein